MSRPRALGSDYLVGIPVNTDNRRGPRLPGAAVPDPLPRRIIPRDPVPRCATCGPWETYAGSGMSCSVCHRPHPDSWAARCRGGQR